MSARALRQINGGQRSCEWLAHFFLLLLFLFFISELYRTMINRSSLWRSHRNTIGDDVNKFSLSERVRSLARCDDRLRRHWNGTQKCRRFMLPRTLPAMIIGAFISTILSSRVPILSLIFISPIFISLSLSLFKIILARDGYFQVDI